uniref:Innexin n=1 Tax=Panagrolaimus sp. ES5 TaxID=591445 RepID=A0AC34FDA8_9BILA
MTSLIARLPPFNYLRLGLKDPLDDLVDRLSSPVSVFLFAIFLSIHAAGLTFGSDFSCAFPPQYDGNWVGFASQYCYVQPFFYMGDDTKHISYFPWVSLVLFAQAFGFFAPKMFWHFAARHSELDYLSIIHFIRGLRKNIGEELNGNIKRMTNFMARHMGSAKHDSVSFLTRSPIVLLYLFKKWLYVFNAILQFYLIIHFVGDGSWSWGVHSFVYAYSYANTNETRLPTSPNFPTFTYCVPPYFVDGFKEEDHASCVMTINFLTEKMYIIAYFWILMVAFSAFLSALYATIYYSFPTFRINFVMSRVKKTKLGVTQWRVNDFLNDYLHADGLLALNLVENSCDKILTEKLLCELWDKWQEQERKPTYQRLPQPLDETDKHVVDFDPNSPLI